MASCVRKSTLELHFAGASGPPLRHIARDSSRGRLESSHDEIHPGLAAAPQHFARGHAGTHPEQAGREHDGELVGGKPRAELSTHPGGRELMRELVHEIGDVSGRIREVMGPPDVKGQHFREQSRLADSAVLIGDGIRHASEEIAQRGRRIAQCRDPPSDPRADASRQLEQHVVLGRKVEIKGSAGDPGRARDPIDLRGGNADGTELLQRHGEDPLARIQALSCTRPVGRSGPCGHIASPGPSRRRKAPLSRPEYQASQIRQSLTRVKVWAEQPATGR